MTFDDNNLDHRMGWIGAMLEAEWALRHEDRRDLDAWIRQHRPHVLMPVAFQVPPAPRPRPALRLLQGGRA